MPFSYAPLFSTLHKKGMRISDFRKAKILSSATIAKINRDEALSLEAIDKICTVLDCDITDVLEHRLDKQTQTLLINAIKNNHAGEEDERE